jgi:phosphatidylglycerol:prolipoprotein diacylglycerol transferase
MAFRIRSRHDRDRRSRVVVSIPSLTYTEYLVAGALLTAIAVVWQMRRCVPAERVIDCLLAALFGALIAGRAGHVLLHWDYFSANPGEIVQIQRGGSDWHGALLGGWIGAAVLARVRGVPLPALLEASAPAIPCLLIAGWLACGSQQNTCGFGAEIATLADAPPGIAVEAPDVYGLAAPRWNTWAFGVALGAGIGLILLLRPARGRRWGLALLLAGAGMFFIGGLRGDSVSSIAGLRADQWLDAVVALSGAVRLRRRGRGCAPSEPGI